MSAVTQDQVRKLRERIYRLELRCPVDEVEMARQEQALTRLRTELEELIKKVES